MPSILPQLIINGLIAGAIYALAASGFSLVYYVIKFQYFSHGAIMSISAYLFFAFLNRMGLNYLLSGFLVIIFAIIITLMTNWIVYLPLRKRKATPVILLIASISVLIFLNSLILAIFGSSTKSISLGRAAKIFNLGVFTITSVQLSVIVTALILFLFLWYVLKKTKLGKSMRALADNKDAAQVVGINPEKVYNYTFALSAVFGAVGGVLLGLEQNLYPRMGVLIIIKGFISAVVGGLGSVPGSIIGGFFIGLVENLGIWFLPSGYKDVISFSVMLIFLLFRPQGMLGVKTRDDN